jgi:hypothetical protein
MKITLFEYIKDIIGFDTIVSFCVIVVVMILIGLIIFIPLKLVSDNSTSDNTINLGKFEHLQIIPSDDLSGYSERTQVTTSKGVYIIVGIRSFDFDKDVIIDKGLLIGR